MTNQQFRYLFNGWLNGTLTADQANEFFAHVSEHTYNELLHEDLELELEAGRFDGKTTKADRERILTRLKNHTLFQHEKTNVKPIRHIHFLRTTWFRVAAAILIFAGIGAYLWLQPSADKTRITQSKPVPEKNDVLPGANRAILKLADGSEILLDSAANGHLGQQSGANIEKTNDGQIVYSFNKRLLSPTVSYNTMSTPRGGQYQLTLPDGSKVWLNAESSITFPTIFTGNNREVKIIGEAYFEIAKNKEKPFIVKTAQDEITVLGTSFNVNAYADETNKKTALIAGSIRVNNIILKPGQAYLNEKIINTNIDQDLAWKNGVFNFENLDLQQAMRQLSRWYDLEIRYEVEPRNIMFEGSMRRSLKLSQVIEGLEGIGGLHYERDGRILIVSKK